MPHASLVSSQEWVPATAGLAADQLIALLRDKTLQYDKSHADPQKAVVEAFRAAVASLHKEYLAEFEAWRIKLGLLVSL